jgi:signal peptidase I
VNPKTYRYLLWPLWFVIVPAALSALTYNLVAPAESIGVPITFWDNVQFWVKDQPVPTLIVLFTIFEMVLYSYRHSLPGAQYLGATERSDVPKTVRREYEQASHLLDEAERIQRKNRSAVERALTSDSRGELSESLEDLRDAMAKAPFDENVFLERYDRASRLVGKHLGAWQKGELREYLESIGVAVGVALLLRAAVVEAFKIPSGSMLPTLQIQDHIFVNKLAYGPPIPFTSTRLFERLPPKRGDVMVFEYPDPNPAAERQDFIKRVIAVEGDTLEVRDGHPIINGWTVPSCRVGDYAFDEGPEGVKTSDLKHGELYMEYLGEYAYLTLYEFRDGEERRPEAERKPLRGKYEGPYHVKPGETWVLGDNRNNSSDSRAWNGGRGGGVPAANIKGRAMFVWLNFKKNGWPDVDRLFTHVLGTPKLPVGAPADVLAGIDRCLKQRPPFDQTLPPQPNPNAKPSR